MSTEQSLLNRWSRDFSISWPVVFDGYQPMTALGRCRYAKSSNRVTLHPNLKGHPLIIKAVLWHEFAHHARHSIDGGTGHDEAFRAWHWKKPMLALIDVFLPSPSLIRPRTDNS